MSMKLSNQDIFDCCCFHEGEFLEGKDIFDSFREFFYNDVAFCNDNFTTIHSFVLQLFAYCREHKLSLFDAYLVFRNFVNVDGDDLLMLRYFFDKDSGMFVSNVIVAYDDVVAHKDEIVKLLGEGYPLDWIQSLLFENVDFDFNSLSFVWENDGKVNTC